jgi:hypothetical protein
MGKRRQGDFSTVHFGEGHGQEEKRTGSEGRGIVLTLIWCPPAWCCGNLYLVADVQGWLCPFSGAHVPILLSEADWQAWSEPRPLLTLFEGRQRKLALLLEAVRRAGLEHALNPSGKPVEPPQRNSVCDLMRDILGYPCREVGFGEAWLARHADTVVKVARCIYDEDRFTDLPVLADALEEAGCTNSHILAHCRGPGPHVRGCWVVDLVLGKN